MRIINAETGMIIYLAEAKDDYDRVLQTIRDDSIDFTLHIPRSEDIDWNVKEPLAAIYDGNHRFHRVAFWPRAGYIVRDIEGEGKMTFIPKESVDWRKI